MVFVLTVVGLHDTVLAASTTWHDAAGGSLRYSEELQRRSGILRASCSY